MEILFCDLCNESVPESDLSGGQAVRRKGRVICARCEAAMTAEEERLAATAGASAAGAVADRQRGPAALVPAAGSASAAPPVPRVQRTGGFWIALIALLFSAAATTFVADELQSARREGAQAREELAQDLVEVEGRLATILGAMDRLGADLAARQERELVANRAQVEGDLAALGRELAEGVRRLGAVESDLAALVEEGRARGTDADRRLDELTAQLLRSREDMSFTGERLAALEQVIRNGVARQPEAPLPAAPAPPWHAALADLKSDNAGTRWNAVQTLGESGDPAVVEHLFPLLKDEDVFVRMAVARVLGDLAAPRAIEPLIDALEDPETVVRETAMLSLRAITKRDFKFDAAASPAERARKVKAWRDWWEKARADYGLG